VFYCDDVLFIENFDLFQIPTHGRWRHADAGRERVKPLIDQWAASPNPPDKLEVARRLLDLFLVSGNISLLLLPHSSTYSKI
jgi:hypothetical protein